MNKDFPVTIYLHRIFIGNAPCEDVTWCQDRVEVDDVEYVRKDLYDKLFENYKKLQDELFGTNSPERWNDILEELGL